MTVPGEWAAIRAELARELAELAEDEFVVLGEPQPEPGPRTGLLRRRAAPEAVRYVQFRRDADHLYAECVGAALFGGDWEVSPETHERLVALGWLVPGQDDGSGVAPSYPNYWRLLPRESTDDAAALGVGSLALLGAGPSALEWRRDA